MEGTNQEEGTCCNLLSCYSSYFLCNASSTPSSSYYYSFLLLPFDTPTPPSYFCLSHSLFLFLFLFTHYLSSFSSLFTSLPHTFTLQDHNNTNELILLSRIFDILIILITVGGRTDEGKERGRERT